MGYRLEGWGLIPSRARDFSLLHSIQTISEAHSASYEIGTEVSFPGSKTTKA
jgi:hypothetical protein